MIKFTFQSIFKTKAKGLPNTNNLPASSILSNNFYTMSLIIQIVIAIVFVFYFGMAVFRSVKKIKNRKFIMSSPKKNNQNQNQNQQQTQEVEQKAQTKDQLIYKFDEDHQKQNGQQQNQQQQNQKQKDDYDNQENDQQDYKTITYLQIDSGLLAFTPLLIIPIIVNNSFAMDTIATICSSISIILYAIFNIKRLGSKFKIFSSLYLIPAIGAIVPFFINDHDMST